MQLKNDVDSKPRFMKDSQVLMQKLQTNIANIQDQYQDENVLYTSGGEPIHFDYKDKEDTVIINISILEKESGLVHGRRE